MANSIAVAGKGGTGKSTLAALFTLYLKRKKQTPILAIDSDPDANFGSLLGINAQKTLGDLKNETIDELKNLPAGMTKASYFELGFQQIIEETSGIDLLTMGRSEGAGCYCYLNNLVRKFHEDLMSSYKWVVIDNEAGLEHLSRRTTDKINTLIVVVDNNPLSYSTAARIDTISDKLKISVKNKFIIGNMIREGVEDDVKKRVSDYNMEYICSIPYIQTVVDSLFKGIPLIDVCHHFDEYMDLIFSKVGGNYEDS
jgi:CO dehydrogenase maturation factor